MGYVIGKKNSIKSSTEQLLPRPLPGAASYQQGTLDLSDMSGSSVIDQSEYIMQLRILDIVLFLFAAWAQFGYSFYSQENAQESISDPFKRYLYPHISAVKADQIALAINIITRACSIADALLTVGTYINMRHCREELVIGFKKALQDFKDSNVHPALLVMNGFLIWSFFIIAAFAPWAGFARAHNGNDSLMVEIAGFTMWIGLLTSYSMSYASYTFSAAKKVVDFYCLPKKHKRELFCNIFWTKKGILGFLPRAITSLVNRSWVLYGSANLTVRWVFGANNRSFGCSFGLLSAVASAYQTFMSQTIKDYNITFTQKKLNNNSPDQALEQMSDCGNAKKLFFKMTLSVLLSAAFLLRTLAVPSLYTGEIADPENNYTTKDATIALLGLVFGAYAAYQYAQFRHGLWRDSFFIFFKNEAKKFEMVENVPELKAFATN